MSDLIKHLIIRSFVVFLLLQCSVAAIADAGQQVLIVVSKDTRPYQMFVESLRDRIFAYGSLISISITTVNLDDFDERILAKDAEKNFSLVVTVGSKPAVALAQLHNTDIPVLCTMLPKSLFDRLRKNYDDTGVFSAIYIDQPESRVFDLIRVVLPNIKNVGLLVSESTRENNDSLTKTARRKSLHLELGDIDTSKDLVSVLKDILQKTEVLLTVPNPMVLNRNTVQSILLTAYLHKIPVVSYSPGYVRAGALMAVYSSPAELGRYVGEKIVELKRQGYWQLDEPKYPKYFSIALNKKVASSMGILISSADDIRNEMYNLSDRKL